MSDSIPPSDLDIEIDEVPAPLRGVGRMIAVGGGRGGVGKSLLSVNLAVYLAQLGKAVVLVDGDPIGSNIHAHFGLTASNGSSLSRESTPQTAVPEPAIRTLLLFGAVVVGSSWRAR